MELPEIRVQIDTAKSIDEGVILGYRPVRNVKSLDLVIGRGAVIRSGSVIYAGSKIGTHLETGHNVIIREENSVGDHFSIAGSSILDYGCTVGSRVKIHSHVYVAQFTQIEDDVFLAPGVVIANDKYPGSADSRNKLLGPRIKRGAQIGINVSILPGVTIGEGAVIGSGSTVTKDIPDRAVAYGNPARIVRTANS